MNSEKYIGMTCIRKHFDCSAEWCGKDRDGMRHRDEASVILQFIHGLSGDLQSRLKKEPGPPGCTTC